MAFNTYPTTSTWGQMTSNGTSPTVWNGVYYGYFQVIQRTTERVEALVEKLRASRRHRPRYPLPVWPEPLALRGDVHVVAARSHRRTVVPRGTVSWIRAGTRRPL